MGKSKRAKATIETQSSLRKKKNGNS